jgi:hypothetical protein
VNQKLNQSSSLGLHHDHRRFAVAKSGKACDRFPGEAMFRRFLVLWPGHVGQTQIMLMTPILFVLCFRFPSKLLATLTRH